MMVSVQQIKEHSAKYFDVLVSEIEGPCRESKVITARYAAIYLVKKTTKNSLPNIGKLFGGRDHTTIMYALRQAEERLANDEYFSESVLELANSIVSERDAELDPNIRKIAEYVLSIMDDVLLEKVSENIAKKLECDLPETKKEALSSPDENAPYSLLAKEHKAAISKVFEAYTNFEDNRFSTSEKQAMDELLKACSSLKESFPSLHKNQTRKKS